MKNLKEAQLEIDRLNKLIGELTKRVEYLENNRIITYIPYYPAPLQNPWFPGYPNTEPWQPQPAITYTPGAASFNIISSLK